MVSLKRILFKTHDKDKDKSSNQSSIVPNITISQVQFVRIVDRYSVIPPYCFITIAEGVDGRLHYVVNEPVLSDEEFRVLDSVRKYIVSSVKYAPIFSEVKTTTEGIDVAEEVVRSIVDDLGLSVVEESIKKISYYIARDFFGYGVVDPLIRDPNIEDITCNGVDVPIHVFHRLYDWLTTNVVFRSVDELETIVRKLAFRAGQEPSYAKPIVEGIITPEGYRVHIVLDVIARRGHSFTIRKYRAEPFTIIDLINLKTIDPLIAAYLWIAVENKQGIIIYGPTGSGKTTLLNAIAMLLPPELKVVCIAPNTRIAIENIPTIDEIYRNCNECKVDIKNNVISKYLSRSKEVLVFNNGHLKRDEFDVIHEIMIPKEVKLVKITTEFGAYVTVTPNTKIPVLTEDGVIYKSAIEIKKGDVVPQVSYLDFNETEPNVVTLLRDAGFRVRLSKSIEDSKKHKLKSIPIDLYVENKERLPNAEGLYLKGGKRVLRVPIDKLPSPEISYLAGLVVGDGHISSKSEMVVFASKDEEILKRFLDISLKYIDKASIVRSSNEIQLPPIFGRYLVVIYEIPKGNKSRVVRVPKWLFRAPIEHVKAFLAGLLDADGDVDRGVIRFFSINEELIEDIAILALRFRAVPNVYQTTNRKNGREWSLWVADFYGEHASHLANALKKYSVKIQRRYSDVEKYRRTGAILIPSVIGKYLANLAKKRGISLENIYKLLREHVLEPHTAPKPRYRVNREELLRVAKKLGLEEEIKKLINDNIIWVYVKNVEYVDHDGVVYDITPKNSRYFAAGNMGLLIVEDSAEDTHEITLPLHDNWVYMVTRLSREQAVESITLQAQVESALRQRPDVIILGEIRSREAYSFFQALSSVSWDTPILIRDIKSREVKLIPIGEFVDKYYNGDEERVPKFINGYEVLTISSDGKVIWVPIRYILRHRANEIYRIRYSSGGEIRATASHSVFVLDEDTLEIKEKLVKDLKVGDLLVSFVKKTNENSENPVIDVIELIGNLKKDYVLNIPKELRSITGHNPLKLVQYLRVDPDKKYRSIVKIRRWYGGRSLDALIEIDEDLAFVMGVYLADGCVKTYRSKRLCFTLGKSEESVARRIEDILWKRFKVKPTVTDRGTYKIYEYSHTLLAELFEKLLGARLEEKRVPLFLWNAPRDIVKAFLEGYKADSRRTLNKSYVHYSTKSKRLALELIWLARLHGLYSFLIRERSSNNIYYGIGMYLNRDVYCQPNTAEVIPIKPLRILIKRLRPKSMPWKFTYINRENRRFISRRKAMEILKWILRKRSRDIDEYSNKLINRLKTLLNGEIILVRVKEIKKEPYNGFVYDVSVPGTEAFFGGETPILLHNTGHGALSTIHAEDIGSLLRRLAGPPMNVPKPLLGMVRSFVHIVRLTLPEGIRRKVIVIHESLGYNPAKDDIDIQEIIVWDRRRDKWIMYSDRKSALIQSVALLLRLSYDDVYSDLKRRATILHWAAKRKFDMYRLHKTVREYRRNPEGIYKQAIVEVGEYEI